MVYVQLGHRLVDPYPALTPLVGEHPKGKANEQIPGVSLDVSASVVLGKKKIEAPRTGFLFTHKGYSGPAVLDLSHHFVRSTQEVLSLPVALTKNPPPHPKLVVRWTSKSTEDWAESFKDPENKATLALNLVKKEIPARLATSLYESVVTLPKKCSNLTRKEKTNLAEALGAFELSVTGHQGYAQIHIRVYIECVTSMLYRLACDALYVHAFHA
jgi:predicted flavoprotein YhiN